MKEEIKRALKAKNLILWIKTTEEARAERLLIDTAPALSYTPSIWTQTAGLYPPDDPEKADIRLADPGALFKALKGGTGRRMIIMKDFSPAFQIPSARRYVRDEITNARRRPADNQIAFIFIDLNEPPPEVPGIMKIDLPLPGADEIGAILDVVLNAPTTPDNVKKDVKKNGNRGEIVEALTGLNTDQITNAMNRSRIITKTLDPAFLIKQKKELIKSEAVEWIEPDPRGMAAVGGLDVLKDDLDKFKVGFSPEAREWGLPAPKGILIVGIPGTGKSLTAKVTAAAYKMPLLRLNISALFGKFVGDSESNLRAALKTVDACAPAILWIDEIEKGLAGAGGSGETDGGTTKRVFGELLTWLNDRPRPVFLLATANDVNALPPELKRAGRFDRLYWIDTPNRTERTQIAEIMMKKYPRTANVSQDEIADAADDYTGAEIEEGFKAALNTAYRDGKREPTTADVINGLKEITPIIKAEAGKLDAGRRWAKTAARNASTPDGSTTATGTAADFELE